MPVLQPDPDITIPPLFEAMDWFWREVHVTPATEVNVIAQLYLEAVREVFGNTGVEFAAFHVAPHPVLEYHVHRNTLDVTGFFEDLLLRPEVLPYLESARQRKPKANRFRYAYTEPFCFDGILANIRYRGGAHDTFRGSPAEAKQIASEFTKALFHERYDEMMIYSITSATPDGTIWSDWFHDIAWDYAYAGWDKRFHTAWFLCMTSTD